MKSVSWWAWIACVALIVGWGWWYYPPAQPHQSRVLQWDAAGYYLYLPAIFVHHDLRDLHFRHQLVRDYAPSGSGFDSAFPHPSGHMVLKYPAGLALQELPFFLVAHALAEPLGYAPDGYSDPYQLAMKLASLLVAILSLWLVRRALLPRFGEWATAGTLLILVLGTNYLNYSAGQGSLTHNWLFGWYAALLLLTPAYYARPTAGRAAAIGAIIGLMTLTRPTELLAVLLPLLWGLRWSRAGLRAQLGFWQQHAGHLLLAAALGAAVLSIQPLYWYYASGQWVVYSYQEQGFSWLKPHLFDGIFSFRSGWLMYSPLLITALVGFGPLRRQQPAAFWPMLVFMGLFVYVAFAWDEWTYGGSLGQRAMVQTYAVLAWPLAAALRWLLARPVWAALYGVLAVLGCAYGFWLSQMAQGGGLLAAGEMTRTYLWRILFRYQVPLETRLLLDSNSEFTGTPRNLRVLWQQDFEQQPAATCGTPALAGNCSLHLDAAHPSSSEYRLPVRPGTFTWLRASALAGAPDYEWDVGRMTQYVIRFWDGPTIVKERTVRLQRALEPNLSRTLSFTIRPPRQPFDHVSIVFLYYGTTTNLRLDNARLEAFD